MAAADTWSELGIAPTADASAIRRAYAARLKRTRPDTDPQGFTRLRAAYEHALLSVEADAYEDADGDAEAVPAARPVPRAEAPAVPQPPAAMAAIAECLRRGEALDAAGLLAAARAAGTLSLQQDLDLADQLGWTLAEDRSLPADTVRRAADRLGWLGGDTVAPWAAALRARLEAEQWLAALRRSAASPWAWVGASAALSARLLLGRGTLRTLPVMSRDPTLRRRYGEFLLYAGIVGDQFDPVRIESLAQFLTGRASKPVGMVATFFGVVIIASIVGAGVGEAAPGWKDAATGLTMTGLFTLLLVRRLWRRVRSRGKRP